jgi:hypothetical protein
VIPGLNAAVVTHLVTHRPRLLSVLRVGVASRGGGLTGHPLASAGLPAVPVLQGPQGNAFPPCGPWRFSAKPSVRT